MTKATEVKLNHLHGVLADVFTEQLLYEEEELALGEDGAVGTGRMRKTAPPALLTAAAKFLKDNNIQCDVEVEDNMNALKDALARKTKRSSLPSPATAVSETLQ